MTDAYIHPTARLFPGTILGRGAWIGPGVVIEEDVVIGAYSVIGGPPEHRAFYDDPTCLRSKGVFIEKGARIFEFVTIHAGTGLATRIGQRAAVFNHSHIAHDVVVGAGATIGGHASLAGHVRVMACANVSGRATIHQRAVVGAYSILAMGAVLKGHVPPGEKWIGSPARPAGLNDVGLARAGLTIEKCRELSLELFEALKEGANI